LPTLLSIDTATETASVCITKQGKVLGILYSEDQKNHAGFIHSAIQNLMATTGISLNQLDAVAVTEGPGSYTGLRVGMATAKGLCYALQKPLIKVNTLLVMAKAAVDRINKTAHHPLHTKVDFHLVPMIDARRMEVFTATYNKHLSVITPPHALIIDEYVVKTWSETHQPIVFSGSGIDKINDLVVGLNNVFMLSVQHHAGHLAELAAEKWEQKSFANLAYAEPFYLKQFFSPIKRV
jgi:tRNA threonylcarbamoyladenosine biosynthesis protein TsaB